jgi:hypothetical protein
MIYTAFSLAAYFNKDSEQDHINDKTDENYSITEPLTIKGNETATAETKTQIVYVPKETVVEKFIAVSSSTGEATEQEREIKEKTDEEINIAKTDFTIKVNGEEQTFTKTDDENYVFENNKLVLEQTSKVDLDVKIEPIKIDNTKHYGLGVGITDEKKPAAILTAPTKNKYIDVWAYGDKDRQATGRMFRF